MKRRRLTNDRVKNYYKDSGRGVGKVGSFLWRLRAFPSFLYQRRRLIETKRAILKLPLNGKILDSACGNGDLLSSLPKGSVGIEINPILVVEARRRAPSANIINGDIEKIPFANNFFSVVLATEIFEHLLSSELAISEMWRVLKKRGNLIVTVPTDNFLWRVRFLASSMYKTEPQCLTFTRKSLLSLFNNYSYKIKKFNTIAFGLNFLLILQKS